MKKFILILFSLFLYTSNTAFSFSHSAGNYGEVTKINDEEVTYKSIKSESEKLKGLVNVYKRGNDIFLDLPSDVDKKTFMLIMQSQAYMEWLNYIPPNWANTWYYTALVLRFKKRGNQLDITAQKSYINPDKTVSNNYRDRAETRYPALNIEAFKEDGSFFLVNITPFLKTDVYNSAYMITSAMGGFYNLNKDNTYIETVKAFPENLFFRVNYLFESSNPPQLSVPDSRSLNFVVSYSLVELKDSTDYVPRLLDSRVGYYPSSFLDLSDFTRENQKTYYINRWNLKKKTPGSEISLPVKPVVFWIDKATPKQFRSAIKEGVLVWNKAFEKIGFLNALECKEQEDTATWDLDDIRYNVIRWDPYTAATGFGPVITNPYTGEIINATAILSSENIGFEIRAFKNYVNPEMNESGNMKKHFNPFCNYGHEVKSDLRFLAIEKALKNGSNIITLNQKFIDSILIGLVSHEIGHTLGLRHNFKASSAYNYEELTDPSFVKENGLASSVMDYVPFNFSDFSDVDDIQNFSGTIGKYDYLAIDYGYSVLPAVKKPEEEISYLNQIIEKYPGRYYVYGTDEDAYDSYGPTSLDPYSNVFDLSSEPLKYARHIIERTFAIINGMDRIFPTVGNSYTQLTEHFNYAIYRIFSKLYASVKFIGGENITRMHNGSEYGSENNSQYPVEPISRSLQLEAMNILNDYLFNTVQYESIRPDLLRKLQPNTEFDTTYFYYNGYRHDFPMDELLARQQKNILSRLYHPLVMKRMIEQENLKTDILTFRELNEFLYNNIWTEILSSSAISKQRRALQKAHLNTLISLLVNPEQGTPEDARAMSYKSLTLLKEKLNSYSSSDDYNNFHVKDCINNINQALNSIMIKNN